MDDYATCGTCAWTLDRQGTLIIGEGMLTRPSGWFSWPWYLDYRFKIIRVVLAGRARVADTTDMFERCNHIFLIDLSDFDTSSVTLTAGMFVGCERLRSLDLMGWDASAATSTTGMFSG